MSAAEIETDNRGIPPTLDEVEILSLRPDRVSSTALWAEKYRHLSEDEDVAEPGPWTNSRTPYLVGMMDAADDPYVDAVVCVKASQIGFTEMTRNLMCRWIDEDPGPCLILMPDELSAGEVMEERVQPMLKNNKRLRPMMPRRAWDSKTLKIKMRSMTIHAAWASSANRIARRAIRYLILDEVDKYPPFAGKEAEPIQLVLKRTETFGHRALALLGCTPTTRTGNIWRWWDSCGVRKFFHVPCPECREYQKLSWSQMKWPARGERSYLEYADVVERDDLGEYECERCEARWTNRQKPAIVEKGVWAGEDQVVNKDGEPVGPCNVSKRVGFHISSLYSPWVLWSKLIAEYLRAIHDPGLMQDFRNNRLAEPFEEQLMSVKRSDVTVKIDGAPEPGILPEWAGVVIAGVDTQKDHFYFAIRAWGHGFRSQLLHHGVCTDFDQLRRVCFETAFKGPGGEMAAAIMSIDSGAGKGVDPKQSRTSEVYEFAASDPARVWPIKGASHEMHAPWKLSRLNDAGLLLRLIASEYYKDMLWRLIRDEDGSRWMVHSQVDDDYCIQMVSEHKIMARSGHTRKPIWVPITLGAPNHYWSAETYCLAAADMMHIGLMPQPEEEPTEEPDSKKREGGGWAQSHKGKY